jgi:hypothetical protein
MRVLLVSANTEKINMPVLPLGLACVAAATQKAGHDIKVVNLMDQPMNKRFQPEEVRHISDMLKGHGIRQMGFLLLGGPAEDKETVKESLLFADSLNLDSMKITIGIRIYPHTDLARTAAKEGLIAPDENLLFPKFYIKKDLEDWLHKIIEVWKKDRPHWIV